MVDGGMAPEVPELRDVLDRLGKADATGKPCPPVVVTLAQVMEALRPGEARALGRARVETCTIG